MLREDISAQVRNIYLDVFVSDQSGVPVPAKAIVDTGAEATFVRPDFASTHFIAKGEDETSKASEIVHLGTVFFGASLDLGVAEIEFRLGSTMTPEQFTAALVDSDGELRRIPIDIIAGMDILENLDFCYFHTVAEARRRTFISIWPAGESNLDN